MKASGHFITLRSIGTLLKVHIHMLYLEKRCICSTSLQVYVSMCPIYLCCGQYQTTTQCRYGAGTGVFVQVLSKCTNIVVTRNDAEGVS